MGQFNIEKDLPNGLHDAEIEKITVDYLEGRVIIYLNTWIGDLDSEEEKVREKYRRGQLILNNLYYLSIEAPDPNYPYDSAKPISIDVGPLKELKNENTDKLPDNIPDESIQYWIYVHEWNSFLYIASKDSEYIWTEDEGKNWDPIE